MDRRKIGNIGEDATVNYLQDNGYEILKRNYTVRGGEIDIIASKDNVAVFIEVKTRKDKSLASGIEAVNKNKRTHIINTAMQYLTKTDCNFQPRFDIALVTMKDNIVTDIEYIENAYDLSDTNIIY